jgi:chromate transporter
MTDTAAPAQPTLAEITAESLKIGCLGFGGPAGQIALMHKVFVDDRKWIDEPHFLHALSYCTVLPGPEAQQLATYIGWLLHGVKGGLIAGLLFVLPGAVMILALSWSYIAYGTIPMVAAIFFGIKAAVIALVVEAVIKIGKRTLKGRLQLALATMAFIAIFVFGIGFPTIIMSAALIGVILVMRVGPSITPQPLSVQPPIKDLIGSVLLWGAIWLAPLAASFATLGPKHIISEVGALFAKLSMVTFGGAYAGLAYLNQHAVDAQGWLTTQQMIAAFGLAETTPGPLVLVNQFVGFLAGWQSPGGRPLVAIGAALMASWQTFAPSFMWIFAGAPFAETVRANKYISGALSGISAAVLGIIASLALWFASHVIFEANSPIALPWGAIVDVPILQSLNPHAAIIALAAGVTLIRYKVNVVWVILGSGLLGIALSYL